MIGQQRTPFHRLIGMGEALPLKSESIDRIASAYVLRNLTDRRTVFDEVHRLLRSGGKGAIIDFSPPGPSILSPILKLVVKVWIPVVGGLLSGEYSAYRYLSRTILAFPSPETIANELEDAGFSSVSHVRLRGGLAVLYTFEKHD
jgi:demethylmenaquinone methyltransferase/2-methoxy-6-polyprenyl-1,4-benzoquinol methylase